MILTVWQHWCSTELCFTELYTDLQKGEKFTLVLASTLNSDNTPLEPAYNAVRLFSGFATMPVYV